MATFYIKNGSTYRPTDEANVVIERKLPVANYVIKQDSMGNLYLDTVDSFTVGFKRYGKNPMHTTRILDTFDNRPHATGVMLCGEKGSGKSLLAKTVSIEAASRGVPTVIINAPWHGDQFNAFIQSIEQPCVVLFDEFEKVYDEDQQEQILTLLDGVFPSKKLFVLTCNDKWRVDSHMRNRPGRIFYMLDFTGIEPDFIEEYCQDNLTAKEHIPQIIKIAEMFVAFNFDMLKALVEEMNRYGETPIDAISMLNVRPEFQDQKPLFVATLLKNDVTQHMYQKKIRINPLADDYNLAYTAMPEPGKKIDLNNVEWQYAIFTQDDLTNVDGQGNYTFVNDNNETLILARTNESRKMDWRDAF